MPGMNKSRDFQHITHSKECGTFSQFFFSLLSPLVKISKKKKAQKVKQYTKSAPLKWINVNKWKPWRAIIECRLLSNYSMPHKKKQKNRIKWILLEHSSTFGNQSTFMSAVDSFAVLLCLFFSVLYFNLLWYRLRIWAHLHDVFCFALFV